MSFTIVFELKIFKKRLELVWKTKNYKKEVLQVIIERFIKVKTDIAKE